MRSRELKSRLKKLDFLWSKSSIRSAIKIKAYSWRFRGAKVFFKCESSLEINREIVGEYFKLMDKKIKGNEEMFLSKDD